MYDFGVCPICPSGFSDYDDENVLSAQFFSLKSDEILDR